MHTGGGRILDFGVKPRVEDLRLQPAYRRVLGWMAVRSRISNEIAWRSVCEENLLPYYKPN
jgi:hypothetical protein